MVSSLEAEGWFQSGQLFIQPSSAVDQDDGMTECDQYLVMYVGKKVDEISQTDYSQLMLNMFLARKADLMHCDARRRDNCMRFQFGTAESVCQLIDWDRSADGGQKVLLHRDSAQCREAPANIQRQLAADTRTSGWKRPRVEVDWDFSDDVAMLLEYMWEKAQCTGERLNGAEKEVSKNNGEWIGDWWEFR